MNMNQQTIIVEGMSCQHCVKSIESALHNIGVIGIVDLTNKSVRVEYDESMMDMKQISQTIEGQGYHVASS